MITGKQIHRYLDISSTCSCFGVYVGYQEIYNIIGPTKIGRSKNAQALQRGRAQGGANWWFDSYFILPNNESTRYIEKELKIALEEYHIKNTVQAQTELYNINPSTASDKLYQLLLDNGFDATDIVEAILGV